MTEIPEEYLIEVENMNPAQRSRYRRIQLASAIHTLIYEEFPDLSNSEIQAVVSDILNKSIHDNIRPKRRIKPPTTAPD